MRAKWAPPELIRHRCVTDRQAGIWTRRSGWTHPASLVQRLLLLFKNCFLFEDLTILWFLSVVSVCCSVLTVVCQLFCPFLTSSVFFHPLSHPASFSSALFYLNFSSQFSQFCLFLSALLVCVSFVLIHFLFFPLLHHDFPLSSSFSPPLPSGLVSNPSSPPPLPVNPPLSPASWFLLILSGQLLSHTSSRSYCSLWWSGRSKGYGTQCSAVAQDQSLSPGRVRLISGLSGLVLAGGSRVARGVWIVDARCSVGGAGVEGAF